MAFLHRSNAVKAVRAAVDKSKKRLEDFSTLVRDAEGERRVGEIARACQEKGIKFVDSEWPANTKALFVDPAHPSAQMESVQKELGGIQWMRPDQMGDPHEPPQVFAEGIDPEDIHQGSIGDCYFLAALAICATREELILDLIVEDFAETGIYGVKMCVMGEWRTIIVDDLLPCRKEGDRWMPIFARWKGTKETWAMIAEKAWAKLHGSYEAIGGGRTEDALSYLSGGYATCSSLEDKDNGGNLYSRLYNNHHLNGKDMGVFISTSGVDENVSKKGGLDDPTKMSGQDKSSGGLVSGHAYSLLDVAEVDGHQLVRLRNPWGSYEWDGDWGDKSPLWTPSRKKQVGFVDADDGSFWMSVEDYRKNFGLVGICKTLPSKFHQARQAASWVAGVNAAGPSDALVGFNPTFRLKPTSSKVWIQLEQPDARGHPLKSFTHTLAYVLKESDVKSNSDGYRVVVPAQSVCPAITLLEERQKTAEVELNPADGPFLVVITTWRAGLEASFQLSVASEGAFTLSRLPDVRATPSQVKAMSKVPLPKECITCTKAVDMHHHVALKGVRWHQTAACNKCAGCAKSFTFSGASPAGGASGLKSHDVAYDGKWGAYCFDCWNRSFGEQCIQCKKPLQHHANDNDPCVAVPGEGKMHQECVTSWQASSAEKCAQCEQPVIQSGKFSGQFYTTDMGSAGGKLPNGEKPRQVHLECWEAFEAARAAKCLHCHSPICELPGKFSGSYYPVDGPVKGSVHAECYPAFQMSSAPKCVQCQQPCAEIPGKFSGRLYQVAGGRLHEECQTDYQHSQAKKCTHCSQPVLAIAGRFSGNYFQTKEGDNVHVECKEGYMSARAKKCAHCHQPIVKNDKFGGSYYPLESGSHVHEECYDIYLKSGGKK
ncbi:hypothetical protein CAOG_06245 [Capsaspora owczarzaki ATCC 30864]|uniref:Calpain catalytic domain-containing protein n=1 Tax=Capsaspora owczarzaki (strain ATCC 30864) TaxID=595528 RepID=A0A0D2UL67_CAPO3|nr:hypothetical protein CAOG_06245 [Capsaspora owczarzaki ATCC 30864]KJE95841.1 hypothetical protein CAOG_006245 [Capsaspora owczarzaki ATCC 30864]|eukprot:XP_004344994.1 hypothetical protein CAOG_06245 [Capsaspora owczarzaki ATCC 30864]